MNEQIRELAEEAGFIEYINENLWAHEFVEFNELIEKFAELIVRECIQVAANQRNPSNLNYKPSERFVEDLKLHFGVGCKEEKMMNREDIIRMAREAGFGVLLPSVDCRGEIYAGDDDNTDEMERFAALVAAVEREECAKTIERARLHMDGSLGLTSQTDFIATRITEFLAARIRAMRQI